MREFGGRREGEREGISYLYIKKNICSISTVKDFVESEKNLFSQFWINKNVLVKVSTITHWLIFPKTGSYFRKLLGITLKRIE